MKLLAKILEESVRRHGADQPITLGHLLNIVKMHERMKHGSKRVSGRVPGIDRIPTAIVRRTAAPGEACL